jgi:guanylate kinase
LNTQTTVSVNVSDTSRQAGEDEVNGEQYNFITVDQMEQDITNNKFIEYGQHDGNWYGTQLDSIREIINSGRMCVIDLNPQV